MAIWTRLPQTNSYYFYPTSKYHQYGRLWIRRIKRKDYWNLAYTMWLFIFLTFVAKIGLGMILPIQDIGSYRATIFSKNISLPYAEMAHNIPSSNHVTHISFDSHKIVKFNGHQCGLEDLQSLLSEAINNDPQTIINLIIDKDLEMSDVKKLLKEINSLGKIRINLMTRKHKHNQFL